MTGSGNARAIWRAAWLLVLGLGAAAPAMAQENLFAPRVEVNGAVVTEYEVIQRAQFIKLLGGGGDPEGEALKALIEERLKRAEAKRLGITVTPEQILQGMNEFAGRANLTAEQFIEAIAQGGIAPETFRDFVEVGLLWREAIRARFAGTVSVSDAEVDRAIEGDTRTMALRVLLSEIVLPVEDEAAREAVTAEAEAIRAAAGGEAGFAAAARRYSAAPTAGRGGRLDWLPLSNLPGPLAQFVMALEPGQVSDPVQVPNAVVLFQLRALERDTSVEPRAFDVEYAEFLIADDAARIAEIRAGSDRCTDLYAFAKGAAPGVLTVTKAPLNDIPQDVALELAKLDPGESSTALARGGQRLFLMLCARLPILEVPEGAELETDADGNPVLPEIDREAIRTQLIDRKVSGLAEQYLEELRAAAMIEERS
jgi:peptidyl-prolyl cis-trans isomerase SurA